MADLHVRHKSAGGLQRNPASPPQQRPRLQTRTKSYPAGEAALSRRPRQPDDTTTGIEGQPLRANRTDHISQDASRRSLDETLCSVNMPSQKPYPEVNLAVIGTAGVGKSTLVKHALELKQHPHTRSSVKKMSLDGTIYLVRLVEIGIHKIAVDKNRKIVWPRYIGELELPPIDGVLALFDSSDPHTLTQMSELLNALQKPSSIPLLIVACKCDTPRKSSQHDPLVLEKANRLLAGAEALQTSTRVPESYKKCVSIVLRAIILRTSEVAFRKHRASPRHRSSAESVPARPPRHPSRQHFRAHSETPRGASVTKNLYQSDGAPSGSAPDYNLAFNVQSARNGRSNSQPVPPRTPPGHRVIRGSSLTVDPVPEESSPTTVAQQRLRTQWRHSAGSDAFNSFLDMEDDMEEASPPLTNPASPRGTKKGKVEEAGVTFDELVDRLVSMPLTKQDTKFSVIFLCLYRKFATPLRLLSTIIKRFEEAENSELPELSRHARQLSITNALAQWVGEYPGDFEDAKTRRRLLSFLSYLDRTTVFKFVAKEMAICVDKVVEDDDFGWALKDDNFDTSGPETFLDTSAPSSPTSNANEASLLVKQVEFNDENLDQASQYSKLSMTSTFNRSGSISSQSIQTLFSTESAQREAQRLEVIPRHNLGKSQWRIFMAIPDDDFARELTRIDWVMFRSFGPRELVRHVSTSSDNKDKPSNRLENVNRMIKQFNHLAYFAASMVLLRDKAKHRAQALEKFMNIAWKLRQLFNYNSLGAIIAGLNGTPVMRLQETQEFVSSETKKQFMSLLILMGTQKSHFAYRLAWDNSFSERIPFLPLHLRDLVSAEEGNRTLVGDRINWRKFEIMGDVILGIQRSQQTAYPTFQVNEMVRRLVLEARFEGDSDELYTRSKNIEPPGNAGGQEKYKLFPWRRA